MLVEGIELVEIACLGKEVRLFTERAPELFHHLAQVDDLLGLDEARRKARERAHDIDVLRHDLLGARALHLYSNVLSGNEAGAMDLRKRGATERIGIDGIEEVAELLAVFCLEAFEHHGIGNRVGLGAQAAQLVAIALGQDFRAV